MCLCHPLDFADVGKVQKKRVDAPSYYCVTAVHFCLQDTIDAGKVQKKSVDATRPYLELPYFNRDAIFTKSKAAAGLCEWAINIVK